MSKEIKFEIGKTYYPRHRGISVSSNKILGPGWLIRRDGGDIIFEFMAARQGGGEESYLITEEDFEATKAGKMTFEDLLKKYDRS